jgi:hypothetical protein
MSDGSAPGLREALQLVASLEAHCRKLRQTGDAEMDDAAAELERLLREIRGQLKLRRD